jgi:hypothetical protein
MTKHITTPQDLREMAAECERFNNTPLIQAEEYQRLYLRITRYAPRYLRKAADKIDTLRAALVRYGQHDSSGMSDQPGCQKSRMGGGPCTCGLDEVMR